MEVNCVQLFVSELVVGCKCFHNVFLILLFIFDDAKLLTLSDVTKYIPLNDVNADKNIIKPFTNDNLIEIIDISVDVIQNKKA